MGNSVLNQISFIKEMPNYFEGWCNGKHGAIIDLEGRGVYRFIETDRHGGHLHVKYENVKDNPIVCIGIVAFWLKYLKEHNEILQQFGLPSKQALSTKEKFEHYTEMRFKKFEENDGNDSDNWKRDIIYEFYKNIIPQEMNFNKQTEALLDYVSDLDKKVVRKVMNNYIDYLKEKRESLGYVDHPQLKVLRYLDSGDKFVLEDMPDYEFNTICDELEKGGYIKVYWVEGHVPEDVKLLDKGKAYMKLMEKGGTEKKEQETIVQHTESNCSEVNDEYQFLDTIENKPILALVWKLMQLDGALIKERGDKVVVQKILELITGLPYNSCKKVWEVGNRPITRKAEDIAKLNQLMKSIGMNIQL